MVDFDIRLKEENIPTKWFNAFPNLGVEIPKPMNSEGKNQIQDMKRIRLQEISKEEESTEEWLTIPEEILNEYVKAGRPTKLTRAVNLEKYIGCSSRIYLKREDTLPTHSFKLNTAIAQAYFAYKENIKELVTETGAGQWGTALAYACRNYDIKCHIFWAKVSKEQKELRAIMAGLYGAKLEPSPSIKTKAGREIIKSNEIGTIGSGISEAIEYALEHDECRYVSGSVHKHILIHQSIIGLETKLQLKQAGIKPDVLVACVGGGSNLGGFMFPFMVSEDSKDIVYQGAESMASPRFTKGMYRYDHSDPLGYTPLTCSYTLGMDFVPSPVHTGGLRQHNSSPILGALYKNNILRVNAYHQEDIFAAGRVLAMKEGILPAPESCHAVKAAIDVALQAEKEGKAKNIVVCLSGSGYYDIKGYKEVLSY